MRILLTNDDGINARGLTVLESIAGELSDDIWIVAPEIEQSGQSRALTLTQPVRTRHIEERTWAVAGTPSDCVLLAMENLMDGTPDLILSGVNRGQNMGEDTSFSGTVAAAMFGMQHGVRSIALSQAINFQARGSVPWETAEAWGAKVLRPLIEHGWADDAILNVNFPDRAPGDVEGVQYTRQGFRDHPQLRTEEREDLRGNAYFWIGYGGQLSDPEEGTDLRAIYDGYVSVSPLHVDLTHNRFLRTMREEWQT